MGKRKHKQTQGKHKMGADEEVTDTEGEDLGNMEDPPSKRPKKARFRNYCWTKHNYDEVTIQTLIEFFTARKAKYVFQEEKGGDHGGRHLQGYVEFENVIHKDEMNKITDWCQSAKKPKLASEYPQKLNTRNGRRWLEGIPMKETLEDWLDLENLKPWQKEIIDLTQEKNIRKLHWYWGGQNIGKSSVIRHLVLTYSAIFIQGGEGRDLKYTIASWVEENGPCIPTIVINIPMKQRAKFNADVVESILDGMFFSSKYESKMVVFNPPQVIITANFPPNTEVLSEDRWIIKEVH